MAAELYDLVTLDAVFRNQKTPTAPYYLNWFTRQINFQTPVIMFDKVYGDDRGLAPFVIPTAQGRPQTLAGYDTLSFAPAYVKIKDVVDPGMHIERVPGEALGGSLTIDQRREAVIGELLRKQRVKFQNRNEWLAARAIIDGKVTIKGEDYPETLVDFRRNAALTSVLAGAAKWDVATGDPLGTLKALRMAANGLSGARITKHTFGANAWDLFNDRVDVKELMDIRYGGLDTKVTRMSDGYDGQEYMGRIAGLNGAGAIDVWVDTSKFIDPDTGAESFFLDQNTVVGVSEQVQGVRCFGAIMDKRAGFQALDYFFKNWDNEDPSVEYLLGQSAPLMVPKNPDATFSVKVA